jgi:predicted AlkP superfamily pyrophosphatase or phosphodiesterase
MIKKQIFRFVIVCLFFLTSACGGLPEFFAEPEQSQPTPVSATEIKPIEPVPSATVDIEPTLTRAPEVIPTAPAASLPQAEYLVLIVLDGCRPDYLEGANLPNLAELTASGISYNKAWTGFLENNTPAAHTAISTGSYPKVNGIPGFKWANLATGESFNPTTLEAVQQGEMAKIVAGTGVPTLAGLLKQSNPNYFVAALSSLKPYAAQGLGMGPSDFVWYGEFTPEQSTETPEPEAFISGTLQTRELPGHQPAGALFLEPDLAAFSVQKEGDTNRFALKMAHVLFQKVRPRVLLLNLPETDEIGHTAGGVKSAQPMRDVLEATDQALGELMALYRQAGLFEKTLWIVTADHGMTVNRKNIRAKDLLNDFNLSEKSNELLLPTIRLGKPERADAIAKQLARLEMPGILGVYVRHQSEKGYLYQPVDATLALLPPDLNRAYLYLLDTYAGPYSPDIVLTTNEQVVFQDGKKKSPGSHNLINWSDQHIPLLISGPGVVRGRVSQAPARLVDLLPTITHLMGLQRGKMSGIVLADALTTPLPADQVAQSQVNTWLQPLRDALAGKK